MAMLDTLDMKKLIKIVMSEKIGRGIDFLPRETSGLLTKLKDWLAEYNQEKSKVLRQKILAGSDELLFRKVIKKREYNDILKDMN